MQTSLEFEWISGLDQPQVSAPKLTITWGVHKPEDDSANGERKLRIALAGTFGIREFKCGLLTTAEEMAQDLWETALIDAIALICVQEGGLAAAINVTKKVKLPWDRLQM